MYFFVVVCFVFLMACYFKTVVFHIFNKKKVTTRGISYGDARSKE